MDNGLLQREDDTVTIVVTMILRTSCCSHTMQDFVT